LLGSRGIAYFVAALLSLAACSKSHSVNTPSGKRPYELKVPSHLDPGRAYPLLVLLHGLGGSPANVSRYYGFETLVDSAGFVLALPEGEKEVLHGRPLRYFNATDLCCAFTANPPDDVAYIDAVIDDISAKYRIDPKRIFVVGHSNGGYMAHRYAYDRASRVAAIISGAGAMWTDVSRCRPTEPVAVLQIHGDADRRVPYEGKPASLEVPTAQVSAHTTVADWVKFDGCGEAVDRSAPPVDLISDENPPLGPETVVEKWSGCRGVELWTLRGGSHLPQLQQPRWAESLYAWLMAHPKP
jgi:polyhydroxybutyrate depolymerase